MLNSYLDCFSLRLQGALHNAEDNQIYDPSYYDGSNLGYIDRRNCFRTIMSYPDHVGCRNAGCSGGSCSIVLYFSNTVATYNGHPTGNSRANNAKYIDSKGYFIISFSDKIKPYLLQMAKNFTSYFLRFCCCHLLL